MDLFRQPTTAAVAKSAAEAVAAIREAVALPSSVNSGGNTPWDTDQAAVSLMSLPRREVCERLLATIPEFIKWCWVAVLDHLAALESDLRRQPHALWSHLTIARGAQEALTVLCYIADPSLTVEERLFRIANVWLEDMNEAVNAAPMTHPSGINYRQQAIKERDFCIAELERAGGRVTHSRDGVPRSLTFGQFRTENKIGIPIAKVAKMLAPVDSPEPYRLTSGAAHARPWFLMRNVITDPKGAYTARMDVTGTSVMTIAMAMETGRRMTGAYFGRDETRSLERIDKAHKKFLQDLLKEATAEPA